MSYGWEKFYLASDGLRKSAQNQRDALVDAYCYNIIHVKNRDVPNECVEALEELHRELTLPPGVAPFGGHSGCKYKVSAMSDEEVNRLIELIHKTYEVIERIEKIENDV